MKDLVLSYMINRRANFYWPAMPVEFMPPEMMFVDMKNRRLLVSLSWSEHKIRRRDSIKHIWVKRTKHGSLRIAPGVKAEWKPL